MSETRTHPAPRHLSSCTDEQSATPAGFSIDVLGPLRVVAAGREMRLTSRRQRSLLALLAMNANAGVSSERLVDQLWDGAAPPGALVTLRSYISHIRKALDQHVGPSVTITTTDAGYRLDVDGDRVDLVRFRRAVAAGHQHLRARQPHEAIDAFDAALVLWRGRPIAEIADHEATVALAAELNELRAAATEGRLRALVETGRHVEAVSGLEALVSAEPLRESPRELLMLALYRAGRSAEALEVYRRFRTVLEDELAIEPSPRLDQLVTAILNRDPRLELSPGSGRIPAPPPGEGSPADLVVALIETLQTVSEQMAAVVETLGGRLPSDLGELADLADLVAALGPRYSATATASAIAS